MATELIMTVEANGGQFVIAGEQLGIQPGDVATPLLEELRTHKAAILALLKSRLVPQADPEPDSEALLGEWLHDRCVFRDHSWTAIAALHLDHARWCKDHGRPVCASRRDFVLALENFVSALKAEGITVRDGWCYGLLFKEDLTAHEQYRTGTEGAVGARVWIHEGKGRRK